MFKDSITFFFPSRGVSGVPVLFLNVAEYISNNFDFKVCIVDFFDGYMASSRSVDSKVQLVEFTSGESLEISDTTLVMQAIVPVGIRPELKIKENTRIFFWHLLPDIYFPKAFPYYFLLPIVGTSLYLKMIKTLNRRSANKIADFVHMIFENNALAFMDSSTLKRTNELLGLKLEPKHFLPVACSDPLFSPKEYFNNDIDLQISWVGRVCDFKYHILLYTINSLAELALLEDKKIFFHLIGNGELLEKLKENVKENSHFSIHYLGAIPKHELEAYLIKNIDINVAMGTSALESAKLGIPTLLLDIAEKQVKDYRFRWLHETLDYDLGHLITADDLSPGNESLSLMLNAYLNAHQEICDKSLQYVQNNHSISSVASKFLKFLREDTLMYKDISSSFFKKSFFRRILEYKKYRIWN